MEEMSSMKQVGRLSEAFGKFNIEWQIDNFFLYSQTNISYESPEFALSYLIWKIKIYPNVWATKESAGNVSLFLCRVDKHPSKVVEIKFGIKTANGNIDNEHEATWNSTYGNTGFPKFIARDKLLLQKNELMPSDTLTIFCVINVKASVTSVETETKMLATDYLEMFLLQKNCDAMVKVKEETFLVHKSVLVVHSPVFAAMFETDMVEKKTGILNIPDCEPKAFLNILFYIYSGYFDCSDCEIFNLYKFADKYNVSDFKLLCVNVMICSISIENMCEYYIFGHQFNETNLVDAAEIFFNKNFKAIIWTSAWTTMMKEYSQLTFKILNQMAEKS